MTDQAIRTLEFALFRRPALSWKKLCLVGQVWLVRSRQRRQLLQLTDQQLNDIGISRYDALQEASKPMWRA